MITLEKQGVRGQRFRPKETEMTKEHAEAVDYFHRIPLKGAGLTRLMLDLLVQRYKEETGRI